MKAILAVILVLVLGFTGIFLWGPAHARRMELSSSQIYIHGTPVCVIQQAGEIVASIGMCDARRGRSPEDGSGNGGSFRGEVPPLLEPPAGLPPGHPPVDSPGFRDGRRILI